MNKKTIISFLISVLFVVAILLFVDLKEILGKVFSFGLIAFVIANILFSILFIARGIKWKLIVGEYKKVSLRDSTLILIIGFFFNNFFPARLGEIVRAFVLSKKIALSKSLSLSTVIVDRLTDLMVLLLLFFFSLFYTDAVPSEISRIALILLLFTTALLILFFLNKRIFFILSAIFFWLPGKGKKLGKQLLATTQQLKKRQGIKVWFLSFIVWLLHLPLYYYILSVLGVQLGAIELLVVMCITSLSSLIPSAPGYIGTFEASAILALQIFGVGINTATSFAIIAHLVGYVSTTILGFLALQELSIKFSEIKKEV